MSVRLLAMVIVLATLPGALAGCTDQATRSTPDGMTSSQARGADPPRCPSAPQGTVLARSLSSAATGGSERMRIYLPPGYGRAEPRSVPLLVLLHGGSADETQWIDVGVAAAADCLIASGEIGPMVIVAVDGLRVETRGDGSPPPMERLVVDEILPYLRARYRPLGGRDVTSIGGISRGGRWALRIAADRPDLFSAAGGHSPTTDMSPSQLRSLATHHVRLWLDVGRQDGLLQDVHELAASIRSIGYGALVMTWDGGHDRRYWSHHVEDYLRFYGRAW